MTQIDDSPRQTSAHDSLNAEQVGYKQTLGRRHVQMIAIGGAIGTGLFLGSASRLNSTGPALLFSYAFVGVIAYFLMRAPGELVLHRPTSGAFVSYMREFFGEAAAYVTGWLYWLNWALTGIAELSAVGLYVQYWFPTMPTWATVLVALAVVLVINLLSARAFGEFEFWASILKVGAIVIFLVVGLVVVIGGFDIGGHRAGFANLWSNPGGFWPSAGDYNWYGPILVMSGVVFAYAATEMVGVAASEMEDSEREAPKAVNAVIFRIAIFYCGSILLLVSMLPTTEYKPGISPFVTVFERLALGWMGTLIQLVLIVAALSSLNSGLYSTGRVLRSLGMAKQAPAFTLKMSKQGVPWAGIVMTSVVFVFGAVLNYLIPDAFEVALEAAAIGVIFTWATIFLCQLRLRSLVNRGVIAKSPFQMPGYPYTSIIGLAFLFLVLVGLVVAGWQSSPYFLHKTTFLVVVFGIPILGAALAIGWVVVKPKVVAKTGDLLLAFAGDGVGRDDQDITWVEANPEDRETLLTSGKADLVKSRFKGRIELQEYPKYSECVSALAKGDVDAVTTDDVILAGFAAKKPYKGVLRVVGEGFSDESYGIGVKKGDHEMVTKVNEALKQYVADGSCGRALKANVGPSGYAIPDPPTPGS